MDDLDVQVQGTSISVTGTDFAVTYEKHPSDSGGEAKPGGPVHIA